MQALSGLRGFSLLFIFLVVSFFFEAVWNTLWRSEFRVKMNVCLKRIGYGSHTCTVLGLENIELCPYFAESSLAVVMNPASIGGSISASGDSDRSGGPRGRRGHGWFSWSSWSSTLVPVGVSEQIVSFSSGAYSCPYVQPGLPSLTPE